jgi:hypothetical protein
VNRVITRETKDSTEKKVERAMGIEPTLVAWEGPRHAQRITITTE